MWSRSRCGRDGLGRRGELRTSRSGGVDTCRAEKEALLTNLHGLADFGLKKCAGTLLGAYYDPPDPYTTPLDPEIFIDFFRKRCIFGPSEQIRAQSMPARAVVVG